MKKFALLLVCLALLCGAAAAEQSAGFEPLRFTLWADTAASYEWTCEYDNNGVLAAPLTEIVEQAEGSNYEFYFGVEKPGKSEIFFNYGLNWEVDVPQRSITCNVTVDDEGKCAVKWAEVYPDDRMLVFTLPSRMTSGWSWNYQGESEDGGMVTLVSEEYTPINAGLEGAGGNTVYQMRVEKPGETVLMFNYSNLWEPGAAAQESYAVVVTANEDMEISIAIAE